MFEGHSWAVMFRSLPQFATLGNSVTLPKPLWLSFLSDYSCTKKQIVALSGVIFSLSIIPAIHTTHPALLLLDAAMSTHFPVDTYNYGMSSARFSTQALWVQFVPHQTRKSFFTCSVSTFRAENCLFILPFGPDCTAALWSDEPSLLQRSFFFSFWSFLLVSFYF